jgi:pyruvate dehydrogenase E2 component (dihydrolipoamide acetyltransferase)
MDIRLPPLGEGADSGVVVGLFVKEGDRIEEGQPLLELENEKAVAPIPAPASGIVRRLRVKEGDRISVGQVILSLDADSDAPARAGDAAAERPKPATVSPPAAPPLSMEAPPTPEPAAPARADAEVVASPSIRKLAHELGLDLTRVRGSGPGGRIVMADLRAYLQGLQAAAIASSVAATGPAAAAAPASAESIDFAQWGAITRRPLSPLRQVIARRMRESWAAVPRVTQFDEADITDLMAWRKQHQAAFQAQGARVTLTPLVLKALVATLRQHPEFNASLDDAAGQLVLKHYFHIGVAVDTEAGLLVPVVRNVDRKPLVELAKEVEDLAAKARERKLAPDQMKGGTFTVSNQGGIGGGHFTPIVNRPEVAILGLGRAAWKPVVRQDQIVPRLMLPLAVSYDHRVIDGGAAARFVVDLVRALEEFREMGSEGQRP